MASQTRSKRAGAPVRRDAPFTGGPDAGFQPREPIPLIWTGPIPSGITALSVALVAVDIQARFDYFLWIHGS